MRDRWKASTGACPPASAVRNWRVDARAHARFIGPDSQRRFNLRACSKRPQTCPRIPPRCKQSCMPRWPRSSGCSFNLLACSATASAADRKSWPRRRYNRRPRIWNSRWPRRWLGWRRRPRRRPGRPPASRRSAIAAPCPPNLPRVEVIVDVEDKACACCGGSLHRIGEDQAEMLDYVPAQFRVRLIRRPRYGCRACENAVVQAAAPDRPIDGGMATEALIAQVLIGKYGDHLPLYRQSQIFARQGIDLDRSTLCNWVGRACWWLAPLHELMLSTVLSSPKVFADDTTLPVLDPGNGRTKTGRLWCYAVDNRPWQRPGHPVAAYAYSEDRKSGTSGQPSEGLPRTASGRRLCRVRQFGEGSDGWRFATGVLLGPYAAQVLRHPRRHDVAACRASPAADRRGICDRSRHSRPDRR